MRPVKLLLAIIGLGLLSACGSGGGGGNTNSDPPPTDSVSGTVTFKGAPLAGATVTAFITNSNAIYQTATTDANGNYSFTGISTSGNVPGDFQFWANKTGYGFYPTVGAGASVIRAGYTGQFQGNGATDIGIDFTVIDFVALPNGSLGGANFSAYDGSNPLVGLARTGQTASYAVGDDASKLKGVAWPATRFTDNSNGTVTDHLTGLIWLKNASCATLGPTTWTNALNQVNQLVSGQCGLSDGSTAGQWRVPNVVELESVVDVSQSGPAVTPNVFNGVSSGIYWSSTSYYGGQSGSPNAWAIQFSDGGYINDGSANAKATANNQVWAVRGTGAGGTVQLQATGLYAFWNGYVATAAGDDATLQTGVHLTYPRWVDNNNGTVTDTMTGLIWLKQANCISGNWSAAITSVNNLASGQCGLTDGSTAGSWRMPNRNEMQSLADRMVTNEADFFNSTYTWKYNGALYQAPIFTNFVSSQYYWTSTTDAAVTTSAWTVYSCDYGVYDISKGNTGYTLAVR